MSLQPGQKLGSYEIVSQAGAGGMGEVYKANDPRLDRTVAIKVLPERTADSEDLKERFAREAKAISSLNHPNICILYDIGHEEGRDYLVMEYLEGETLADRLVQGAIPIAETLKIAIQVADALDNAHRQGLVHRDLKPGNVMLCREGAKLLDFGLAKLTIDEGKPDSLSGLTLTSPLTMDGTLVGTMQYMSPEQLEGQVADARSDIFAFGALLYEMATGKRPFEGTSQASLIASVLKEEPPAVSVMQPMVPPMLDQAISQCLEKDPDNRWQTAGDLKRALMWVQSGGSQVGIPAPVVKRKKTRERVQWGLIAALFLVAAALGGLFLKSALVEPEIVRSSLPIPEKAVLANIGGGSMEISPDGTKLAFVARDSVGGELKLWVRRLDSMTSLPLPGTSGAQFPFWSHDSRYLAFFANNNLMKVLATGGPTLTLCSAQSGRGGSWSQDDVILFTAKYDDIIQRVPAAGGDPVAVTVRDSTQGDYTHRWVHFLPNGRDFLFFARTQGDGGGELDAICVASLDKPGFTRILRAKSNPIYAEGKLLFVRDGVLMAQPFDLGKLELVGDAVPITEGVAYVQGWSHGIFSASTNGRLVYRQGQVNMGSLLKIYDLNSEELESVGEQEFQTGFDVSHDNTKVAVTILDQSSSNYDVWIRDLQRGIRNRLTFHPDSDVSPIWSPDDSLIAYASRRQEKPGLYIKAANGVGDERLLWEVDNVILVADWSPDGRFIACTSETPQGSDIMIVPVDQSQEPFPFMQTINFSEWDPDFSPDGRWLAFVSDESTLEEVFAAPFPGPGGKWQVSLKEGDRPTWTGDGSTIIYLDNEDRITSAAVEVNGSALQIGKVETLFPINGFRPSNIFSLMDGGKRIMVNERPLGGDDSLIVLVQNWSRDIGR